MRRLVPLAEFAINRDDSASSLGSGYTPFYADRGQQPRRPLNPQALMGRVTAEVRALLQERQERARRSLTLTDGTCSSQWETKCC